ncbi:centrosome-associated protein 350-like isoform X1 [Arapaima gigas]
MVSVTLWSVVTWTFKGLLCAWRFFWWQLSQLSKYRSVCCPQKSKCCLNAGLGSENQEQSQHHIHSNTVQKRLSKAEEQIQLLKSQLASEKASWERRFMELQRKQQELRDQVWANTIMKGALSLVDPRVTHIHLYYILGGATSRYQQTAGLTRAGSQGSFVGSQTFLRASLGSRPTSASSIITSLISLSNYKNVPSVGSSRSTPHRAFVPHSHLDLQIGHRVRVLLPSGRISTGTVRYLGPLGGREDFYMGVELELPEQGLQDGIHEGQSYFKCKPGHGAFVAFNKLLVAWE